MRSKEGMRHSILEIWSRDFTLTFIAASLISLTAQFQATTFPLYVQHLGGNLSLAGLMTSVYMGTSALCKPFVGRLLNRKPRKRLFLLFGIVFTALLPVFGFLSIIPLIFMIRILVAPCYSICSTSLTTIATDFIPNERLVEGIGYYNLSLTISYAFGASIALYMINNHGYSSLFILCSGCVLCSVLLLLAVRYKEPDFNAEKSRIATENNGKKKGIPFSKDMLPPCIMLFFVLLGTSGVVTYLPTWGRDAGILNIGTFFTVQAITLAISRLAVGRINKRIGTMRTVILSIVLVEISLVGIRFCTTIEPIWLLSLIFGLGSGLIVPSMHAVIILLVPPEERGMANSMFQMANDAGICICSLVLGLIAQSLGIRDIFTYAAVFPLIALIIYFGKVRKQISELHI